MKYFQIHTDINHELMEKFIQFANANQEDDWEISLHCNGGQLAAMWVIVDAINQHKERTTVVFDYAASAGFTLFNEVKCKRRFGHGPFAIIHKTYRQNVAVTAEGRVVWSIDRKSFKNDRKAGLPKGDQAVVDKMTKKERKDFKKGYDVYLTCDRLAEIFPDVERY